MLSDVQGADVRFCDVPRDGKTVASRRPAASEFKSGTWSEIPVPLVLCEATTIEYRLWTNNHQMGMDRLYIFRLDSEVGGEDAKDAEAAAKSAK